MWLQEDGRRVVAVAAHPKPDTVTLVTAPSDSTDVAQAAAQLPPVGAVLVTGGTALTRTLQRGGPPPARLGDHPRRGHQPPAIGSVAAGRPSRRRGQNGGFGPMTTLTSVEASSPSRPSNGVECLFAPQGVLVVGASADPDKLGGAMATMVTRYPQPVGLVNSRGGDGMHQRIGDAAAAVTAEDGRPDLAILSRARGGLPRCAPGVRRSRCPRRSGLRGRLRGVRGRRRRPATATSRRRARLQGAATWTEHVWVHRPEPKAHRILRPGRYRTEVRRGGGDRRQRRPRPRSRLCCSNAKG